MYSLKNKILQGEWKTIYGLNINLISACGFAIFNLNGISDPFQVSTQGSTTAYWSSMNTSNIKGNKYKI